MSESVTLFVDSLYAEATEAVVARRMDIMSIFSKLYSTTVVFRGRGYERRTFY
jgi:hypothetical protein